MWECFHKLGQKPTTKCNNFYCALCAFRRALLFRLGSFLFCSRVPLPGVFSFLFNYLISNLSIMFTLVRCARVLFNVYQNQPNATNYKLPTTISTHLCFGLKDFMSSTVVPILVRHWLVFFWNCQFFWNILAYYHVENLKENFKHTSFIILIECWFVRYYYFLLFDGRLWNKINYLAPCC